MNYSQLEALPAEAYLNPNNFITDFDNHPNNISSNYAEEQYQKGLKIAEESKEIGIAANCTWYAFTKNGGYIMSYEGIGYHACTAPLWRGLLTAKEVYVYRNGEKIKIK